MAASPGGREVGRVSIRVVPDSSKVARQLRGQLRKIEEGISLKIRTEIDGHQLIKEAVTAVRHAERNIDPIDLRTKIDTSKVVKDARTAARQVETSVDPIDLRTNVDTQKIIRDTRAAVKTAERVTEPLTLKIKKIAGFDKLNVDTDIDGTKLAAQGTAAVLAAERVIPKLDIETNVKVQKDRNLNSAARQINGIILAAIALGPVLVPLGAAIVAAFVPVVAIFGAAAAGAGAFFAVLGPQLKEVLESRKDLQKAEEALAKATTDKQRQKAMADIAAATADLSPAQVAASRSITQLSAAFKKLQDTLAPTVLPVFTQGVQLLTKIIPHLTPFVKAAAGAFTTLMKESEAFGKTTAAKELLTFFQRQAGPAILTLGRVFANVFIGIAGILKGFESLIGPVSGGLVRMSAAFAAFGVNASKSKGFQEFIAYLTRIGPEVLDFLGAFVRGGVNLVKALAPIGERILKGFNLLFEVIARAPLPALTTFVNVLLSLTAVAAVGNALASLRAGMTSIISVLSVASVPVLIIVTLFAGLAKVFMDVYRESAPLRAAVDSIATGFRESGIAGAIDGIVTTITTAAPLILAKFVEWGNAAINWIRPRIPMMIAALAEFGASVISWIGTMLPVIVATVVGWGEAFVNWIRPRIPLMIAALQGLLASFAQWATGTALPAIVAFISKWGGAFVSWIGPKIGPMLSALGGLLARLGGWLTGTALPGIVTNLDKWGTAFINWVRPKIIPMLVALGGLLESLGRWLITVALPAIVRNLVKWGESFLQWIGPRIPGMLRELGTLLGALIRWVLGDAIPTLAKNLARLGMELIAWVLPQIPGILAALAGFLVSIVRYLLGTLLPSLVKTLLGIGKDAIGGLIKGVLFMLGLTIQAAADIGNGILNFFKGAGTWLIEMGKDMIRGLISGIKAMAGAVVDAAKSVVGGALDAAKGVLRINSPSKAFRDIGKSVGEGLVLGLTTDSAAKVADAATNLVKKLMDAFTARKEQRSGLIEKLKRENIQIADLSRKRADVLLKLSNLQDDLEAVKPGKNAAAQREAIRDRMAVATRQLRDINIQMGRNRGELKDLQEQVNVLDRLGPALINANAMTALKGLIAREQKILEGLADQRETLGERLKEATASLDEAVKLRDDFASSVAGSHVAFASLLGFDPDFKAAEVEKASVTAAGVLNHMQARLDQIKRFRENLDSLLRVGINQTSYKQLVEAGAEVGGKFAEALLQGDQGDTISKLNTLQSAINETSAALGVESGDRLYQAGVDAAKGFLEGLQSQDSALAAQMTAIADNLVLAVKRALDIDSPSKVLRVLGRNTTEGFRLGILDDIRGTEKALTSVVTAGMSSAQSVGPTNAGPPGSGNGSGPTLPPITVNYPPDKPTDQGIIDAWRRTELLYGADF